MSWDADVTVVGAGAAGLSLAVRLTEPVTAGTRAPRVVVVEAPPGPLRPPERTWCYWEAGAGAYDEMLTASWDRLRVYAPDGAVIDRPLGPLRYKMLRSDRFEAGMTQRLDAYGVEVRPMTVETARDTPGGAVVRGRDASGAPAELRSRLVFDSRPPRRLPAARTTLLQHFRGWFVRTARPAFDPGTATLMDFRLPQPPRGLAFGYVLPLDRHEALVEYTEFSPATVDDAAYERALRHYCGTLLGLGEYVVRGREQGVIPMSDGRFPRRTGRRVFLVGAAGGATRPSTGYTFAAIQRQSGHLAAAVRAGRSP
ncbi:lycopene cyclase family protein, partial [Streptomyces sp. G-G2]|uniref:lycopene cyclase family protein n=1 Tax=Streptomyces sp. G-G2 TaxID=3046201 RepID=UPI0024BB5993